MRLFVMILLAGWTGLACAQLYKWTDSEGRVHYSDLPQLPSTKGVEKTKLSANVIESDAMPYDLQQVARKHPLTLYTYDKCGEPCTLAQQFLDKRGAPYIVKNGRDYVAEIKKLTGDNKMPVLLVGTGSTLKGFHSGNWNTALDKAGYPKTNPLAKFHKHAVKALPAETRTQPGLTPVSATAP